MSPIDPASAYYEFGPFRLEQSSRSLYEGTDFISVTPKVLDLLFVLVENAGRLVSKEELMQRVWPDAFVEEGSLANNISILRKILNPHFEGEGPIATEARRGYRFTAPVTLRNPDSHSAPEAPRPLAPQEPYAQYAPTATNRRLWLIASVVLLVLLGGLATMYQRPRAETPAAVRRSVAVLPMKNLSGDTAQNWLSMALSETISAELAGGNHFRLVSGENVVRMQQELAPPMGVGLTRKELNDIGSNLACDLILTGNYVVVGGKIRVDVRLDEVATGDAIATATITDTTDRFLDIVSKAGADLRATLHLDPQTPADAEAMRAAFSGTPEALRSYFQGLEALRLRDGPRARDFLLDAVGKDQDFALAHAALSTAWRVLGYDHKGAESAKHAFELSSRLSREDRLGVEAQYHEATAGWPKAIELYQELWRLYPDNIEYGLKLGNAQWSGGKSADTLKTVDDMRARLARASGDSRIDLLEATAADVLADRDRATAAANRAADRAAASKANLMLARARLKQGVYMSRVSKFDEAFAYWRESEALFAALKDPGGEADAIRYQAFAKSDRNDIDGAIALFDRANTLVAPLNYVRLASTIQAGWAAAYRLKGDLDRARVLAEQSLANARECGDRTLVSASLSALALVIRYQGDYVRARDLNVQAAAEADAIGDIRNRNVALNNGAAIDFVLGNLDAARKTFTAVLADDRKAGNRDGIGLRLSNLSRILVLQDQAAEAEKMNEEECRLQEELKNGVLLAWCRTRLAEMYLARGRKADAEGLIGPIKVADFGTAINAPFYVARYARVTLALGRVAAASDALAAAERIQAKAGRVEDQAMHVQTVRAQVDAAEGRQSAAIGGLRQVIAQSNAKGLKTFAADAEQVLAKVSVAKAATR